MLKHKVYKKKLSLISFFKVNFEVHKDLNFCAYAAQNKQCKYAENVVYENLLVVKLDTFNPAVFLFCVPK